MSPSLNSIHSLLVAAHIAIGAVALVLFWVPVLTRKGGPLHRRAGRYYVWAMYAVAGSALLTCLLVLADPVGIRRPGAVLDAQAAADVARGARIGALFLMMLAVLTFVSVRHGLLALRERHQPGILHTARHRGMLAVLGVLGACVGGLGLAYSAVLLMIFGAISMAVSVSMLIETRPERLTATQRITAHFGGLIGSGIGAYTAFFAFGGSRLLADVLPGQWQAVAWVIAPVIGTIAITRLNVRYRSAGRRPLAVQTPDQTPGRV